MRRLSRHWYDWCAVDAPHTPKGRGTRMELLRWRDLRQNRWIEQLGELAEEVREFAAKAELDLTKYPELEDPDWITRVLDRVSSTLSVIVLGQVCSGKSSLVNSLLGRKLFVPDSKPTDGVIAVLNALDDAEDHEYAQRVSQDGTVLRFPSVEDGLDFLRQQKTKPAEQLNCREVRFYLRDPWLRWLRLINTPGLGDRLQAFEHVTLDYLRQDQTDLVLWTFVPTSAANADELGVFSRALASRCGAVLGVVTRSLEGHQGEPDYVPANDPELTGPGGVVETLRTHLGEYLSDIVLYDAHEARRLVKQLREHPERGDDPSFNEQLERCGYASLQRALERTVGRDGQLVEQARVSALLLRCASHARELGRAVTNAQEVFQRQAATSKEKVDAWDKLEREVIEPARVRLLDQIRTIAEHRARELAALTSRAAADTILTKFHLAETMLRSVPRTVGPWTFGQWQSAEDKLAAQMDAAIKERVDAARFWERSGEDSQDKVKNQLLTLQRDLRDYGRRLEPPGSTGSNSPSAIGAGAPTAGTVAAHARTEVMRATVSAVSAAVQKKLSEKGAAELGKQAGKRTLMSGVFKGASLVLTVLTMYDLRKLVMDFGRDREKLAEEVRLRCEADRQIYADQIYDFLRRPAEDQFNEMLVRARTLTAGQSAEDSAWQALAQQAVNARKSLDDLSAVFADRAER